MYFPFGGLKKCAVLRWRLRNYAIAAVMMAIL